MKTFKNKNGMRTIAVIDSYEAGIVLKGTEIKSIRQGKVNFKDSYARVEDNEVWLYSLHISPYSHGNYTNHEPTRKRKLLLNKREIKKILKKVTERGMTIVPKDLYINENNIVKLTLIVGKGKKLFDKREDMKKKDQKRDVQRKLKEFNN